MNTNEVEFVINKVKDVVVSTADGLKPIAEEVINQTQVFCASYTILGVLFVVASCLLFHSSRKDWDKDNEGHAVYKLIVSIILGLIGIIAVLYYSSGIFAPIVWLMRP